MLQHVGDIKKTSFFSRPVVGLNVRLALVENGHGVASKANHVTAELNVEVVERGLEKTIACSAIKASGNSSASSLASGNGCSKHCDMEKA